MLTSKTAGKALASLFLSLLLTLALVAGASAQVDPFEGQEPITNVEAQKYLESIAKMVKTGANQEAIMAIIDESGMEQIRFAYVATKFNAAMAIIKEGQTAAATIPPTVMPTDEEIAVVKGHVGAFDKIMAESAK